MASLRRTPLQSNVPECDYPRRVDELTLRAEKAEQLCTSIDATNVGKSRWGPPPCARRLACNLSGHPVECRRRRGEEPVLQVCGDKQAAAAGQTCSGILSEKIDTRNAYRQDLWNRHLQNPALAVDKRCGRVTEWEEAGSSTAGGSRNGAVCGVVSPFGRRAWFSSWIERRAGTTLWCVHFCIFHRVLSGDLALSRFSDPRLFAICSAEVESGLSVIPAGVMPQRDGLALVL